MRKTPEHVESKNAASAGAHEIAKCVQTLRCNKAAGGCDTFSLPAGRAGSGHGGVAPVAVCWPARAAAEGARPLPHGLPMASRATPSGYGNLEQHYHGNTAAPGPPQASSTWQACMHQPIRLCLASARWSRRGGWKRQAVRQAFGQRGSNPGLWEAKILTGSTQNGLLSSESQWVAWWAHSPEVRGSKPW